MSSALVRIKNMLLYKEVKEKLIQSLSEGKWMAGDKLPVESDLADLYGVSKSTIRAAVGELVDANILARKQGKGTFVATEAVSRNLYRFFYLVDSAGKRYYPVRRLISINRETATERVVEALQLYRHGSKRDIFSIQMLFEINGRVVGRSNPCVSAALFPNLDAKSFEPNDVSLYSLYHSLYNINVVRVEANIGAASATPAIAGDLDIWPGAPLLRIERTAYTYQDTPVEYRTILLDTSEIQYRIAQGSSV